MIIIACGLSTSGKTSLIQNAKLEEFGISVVKGSSILATSGRPVVDLTVTEAISNQQIIAEKLSRLAQTESRIVLDGHLLIETTDGPQLVPDVVLKRLPICGVVLIEADPRLISERRREGKLTTNIEEISDLAQIELTQAKRFARLQGIPFSKYMASEVAEFTSWIRLVTKLA
ncbi:hypothetical protein EN873_40850 [bacterium M00.F.Ca.ET.230.01.1.1]|nr:hypothetical protein EN873_40850 [bacterium M00.F.Ca.ET.230.01.1.1]